MKYKVLSVSTEREVNIGDYVQGLASAQFLPSIDGFIEREQLKQYTSEDCSMIMNGWYMHHPQNWPPSDKIRPLFVAFHINSLAKNILLSKESVAYLKKYEPIGCRDLYTASLLKERGVDAYFSGCMTLTLGLKYHTNVSEDKCYIVDPYFHTNWTMRELISKLFYLIANYKSINKIAQKHPLKDNYLKKRLKLSVFYKEYLKAFTKDTLVNAEYICQQNTEYKDNFKTEEEKLKEAERLIKLYAKAKLVITSRIHCALPCLGLETPVIYIENAQDIEASFCRLNGLKELFTIIQWKDNHLKVPTNQLKKYSINNQPVNKDLWKPLAQQLINRCKEFIHTTI